MGLWANGALGICKRVKEGVWRVSLRLAEVGDAAACPQMRHGRPDQTSRSPGEVQDLEKLTQMFAERISVRAFRVIGDVVTGWLSIEVDEALTSGFYQREEFTTVERSAEERGEGIRALQMEGRA